MKMKCLALFLVLLPAVLSAQEPPVPVHPLHYICYRSSSPLTIDGLMREPEWSKADWTEYFTDIEGSLKPDPRLKTRAKMLWDDNYLYIAAFLEEPHVWATLTERESVIFYDPDFEVFIDPDGDTHQYMEYEMNALNTQWDLLLLKPYRDDAVKNVAIDNWNFNGIRSAVYIDGTLNNASDADRGWYVEIAIPMDAMIELGSAGKLPVDGEQYRINFSRVEWTTNIVDGKYKKRTRLVEGKEKPLPEDNWVWSPQGVIAMHQPETWGFLQFSDKTAGSGTDVYREDPDNEIKWALRTLYYREKEWFPKHKSYSANMPDLNMSEYTVAGVVFKPEIRLTRSMFEATYPSTDGKHTWHITRDGRIWKTAD
jgi:hypothetical protein